MVNRYPHTGVFSWRLTPRQSATTGIVTPGTITTLGVYCRMEPNTAREHKYTVSPNGDRIAYHFTGYVAPLAAAITDGATFTWDGHAYRLVGLHNYQKYTEFMVTK